MKVRREKGSRSISNEVAKSKLSERRTACEFELISAEFSGEGSDTNSENGSESSSIDFRLSNDDKKADFSMLQPRAQSPTNTGQLRARSIKIIDSLDLSMSIAPLIGSSHQVPTIDDGRANGEALPINIAGEKSHHGYHQEIFNTQEAIHKPTKISKLVQQHRNQGHRRCAVALENFVACVQSSPSVETSLAFPGNNQIKWKPTEKASSVSIEKQFFAPPSQSLLQIGRQSKGNGISFRMNSTSVEEQQLLQSLDKLDQRLSKVSILADSEHERRRQANSRERNLDSVASQNTRGHGAARSKPNDDTLRDTGAIQSKLYQPASISVRSSSLKRAQRSSGVRKARVRVGGTFVNDVGYVSTDAGGKHQLAVKRTLSNMVF